MTMQQRKALEPILDQIRSGSYLDIPYGFGVIEGFWKQAIKCNKKQNDLLKANDLDGAVRAFDIKDEDTNQVIRVSVKAKKNYTRVQWFTLLLAVDYQFYTVQQVKKHLTFTQLTPLGYNVY